MKTRLQDLVVLNVFRHELISVIRGKHFNHLKLYI
jgi:hypothetical protein